MEKIENKWANTRESGNKARRLQNASNSFEKNTEKKAPGNTKELRQTVPRKKCRKNAKENTKTLQKLIRAPQTLSTVKLRPHVISYA